MTEWIAPPHLRGSFLSIGPVPSLKSSERTAWIVAARKSGAKQKQIAAALGVSVARVSIILQRERARA